MLSNAVFLSQGIAYFWYCVNLRHSMNRISPNTLNDPIPQNRPSVSSIVDRSVFRLSGHL